MTLGQLFEHGKNQALEAFNKFEGIFPTWILEKQDGKLIIFVAGADVMADKDQVVVELTKVIRDHKIIRYVAMLEAWCVVAKSGVDLEEVIKDGPISEHPQRVEIVHVMAEDKHHILGGDFPIIRPTNGKPYLGKFDDHKADKVEGRFCNLLAENDAIH